jgi:hypothetical protein
VENPLTSLALGIGGMTAIFTLDPCRHAALNAGCHRFESCTAHFADTGKRREDIIGQ